VSDASARFEDWFPPDLDVLEQEGRELLLDAVRRHRAELEAEVGGPFSVSFGEGDAVVLTTTTGGPTYRIERTKGGRLLVTRPPDPGGRL